MGSALETALSEDKEIQGVIPRVIRELFASIQQQAESDFTVKVSYLEVNDQSFSHSEVGFTVKDLSSSMGVLQRGQKVKLV